MTKRASLFGKITVEPIQTPSTPVAAPTVEEPLRKYPVAKTREGKRVATVYLEPEALKQLKRISFDEERTVQELLTEGINAVFEKRGLSRIA